MHPKFSEFLRWGEERGLRKFFCTNGTRLAGLKDDIFRYNVDLLTVSLDGADAETNDRIRRGAKFEEIITNVRELVQEKKSRGRKLPYISIVMTIMESNFRQLPALVELAHDLDIQEIKAVYLTVFEKRLINESLYGGQEKLAEVFSKAEALGDAYGIQIKLPYLQGHDIAGEKQHKDCFSGWRDFFLGSDGYVRPCMSTPDKLFYVEKYSLFDDMWNASEFQGFRSKVNTSKMSPACSNCYQASYANWNKRNSFIQVGNYFSPDWS